MFTSFSQDCKTAKTFLFPRLDIMNVNKNTQAHLYNELP